MMKAKAHGHRVVLVTATRGEVGEIYNMDEEASRPRLGEIRTGELKNAAEILGVDRQEFLGYRDSGMVDTDDNKDPRSFHGAVDEAVAKLAVILREERLAVLSPTPRTAYTGISTIAHFAPTPLWTSSSGRASPCRSSTTPRFPAR